MSTKTINTWDWDVRVRERNLRNGILTEKDVEKMLSGLADAGDRAEPITLPQPALSEASAANDEGARGNDE
jgi:hypothetical protein